MDYPKPRYPQIKKDASDEELMYYARYLANAKEYKSNKVGFSAYGNTKPGDRVLMAAENLIEPRIVANITQALKEKGATVDQMILDFGQDREVEEMDEINFFIGGPGRPEPEIVRRMLVPWIYALAGQMKYDLLIQGNGGPSAKTVKRHAGIPWPSVEVFASETTTFPAELSELINRVTWDMIWTKGRGGKVHLTDAEGTDLTFTLWEEYYERPDSYGFAKEPRLGHLFCHPVQPLIDKADDNGILAGTTNHVGRPFPHLKVHFKDGVAVKVEGGGKYGEEWRKLLEETRDVQYPGHPRPGMFWLWEVALGTHPKAFRPTNFIKRSSWASFWERYRSGMIHVGVGTCLPEIYADTDTWAMKNGKPYGHIHVHLLFPTYEITTKSGEKIKVVDRGHLTALDHPEVRAFAAKYGDPDEVLKIHWVPALPGINTQGDYMQDYGKDPVSWMKKELSNYKVIEPQ
ncbi:MAG: hypothetical protein HYU39_09630 [Thaumarchaeota archaeon]|nr:hypothetical protein [Nitrososphaerota archaeon]